MTLVGAVEVGRKSQRPFEAATSLHPLEAH